MVNPNNISVVNEQVQWTITVTNGPTNNVGVFVTLTPDAGWVIDPGSVLNQGTLLGNIWTIGAMTPGQVVSAVIMLRKTINLLGAPWNHIAVVTGLDTLGTNNTLTDTVGLVSCPICPPAAGAVPDPYACLCGFANANDTPCTTGITSYIYEELSLVNVVIDFWDEATSQYHVTPIDPFLPWSFTYSIWCDNGGGPLQISGPALVSGPARFSSYDKFPRLIKEDFVTTIGGTFVTLSQTPLPGFQVFAYRGGLEQDLLSYGYAANQVNFVIPFGPSGGGLFGETVSIHYYVIL